MGDEPNPPLIRFLCFHTQPMRKLVTEGYLRPVYLPTRAAVMAPKLVSKGKEKDGGEGKVDKLKAYWGTSNKKLFMDLALKRLYHPT